MMSLTSEEKKKFLKALEEDDEFRYAIAGLVGYKEILARLEEHDRKFQQILARLEEHDRKFEQIMARLEEHDRKFQQILARLEEHDRKFEQIMARLEEHDRKFQQMVVEIKEIRENLGKIGSTIERLSLSIEEEGREVISWLLRKEGLEIEIDSVEIGGAQYDIYGEADNLVIIGEVKTRLSAKGVQNFAKKVEKLLKIRPEMKVKKVIKVMYAMVVLPEALKIAEVENIIIITVKGVVSGKISILHN